MHWAAIRYLRAKIGPASTLTWTISKDLVSVALVTDPFRHYDPALLESCFDVVIPFKEHFVADLSLPLNSIVSSHHRQYSRRYSREWT